MYTLDAYICRIAEARRDDLHLLYRVECITSLAMGMLSRIEYDNAFP